MLETQGTVATYHINDILPPEMLGSIFEEHARLEWRAPAIDGQVCRLWRQITLNSPRVWTYLEIDYDIRPSLAQLRSWLCRSGAAPLHIRVYDDFMFDQPTSMGTLYHLLGEYHTRIASLRMALGKLSFFDRRAFPCMRHLVVDNWAWRGTTSPTSLWGLMPQLQSLHIGALDSSLTPLEGGFSLKILSLDAVNCTSLPRHSHSLTTLMLEDISLETIFSHPVVFPLLTYLSLFNITGLKPSMSTPCLTTYHEGGITLLDSFSTPIQSLVEYGVYSRQFIGPYTTRWNHEFPNISRLSMRSDRSNLMSLLEALAAKPQPLPALQVISVRDLDNRLTEDDKNSMRRHVQIRREASHVDTRVYFETARPYQVPMLFASVTHPPNKWFVVY